MAARQLSCNTCEAQQVRWESVYRTPSVWYGNTEPWGTMDTCDLSRLQLIIITCSYLQINHLFPVCTLMSEGEKYSFSFLLTKPNVRTFMQYNHGGIHFLYISHAFLTIFFTCQWFFLYYFVINANTSNIDLDVSFLMNLLLKFPSFCMLFFTNKAVIYKVII